MAKVAVSIYQTLTKRKDMHVPGACPLPEKFNDKYELGRDLYVFRQVEDTDIDDVQKALQSLGYEVVVEVKGQSPR